MTALHVISNPERQVRVNRLHNEMKRQGIVDYRLWPSIHLSDKPKRTGISRAHKQIVDWAANEGLPEVTIVEDDVWFPSENGWKYYLENKPKHPFDQYLGGLTRGDLNEQKITSRYTGQFCYTITERFYDTFLGVDERLDIDGAMASLGVFHVCYPYACFCYPGWSDNCMQLMDHSHLLIGREIFGFGVIKNNEDAKRFSDLARSMQPM